MFDFFSKPIFISPSIGPIIFTFWMLLLKTLGLASKDRVGPVIVNAANFLTSVLHNLRGLTIGRFSQRLQLMCSQDN